MLRVLSPTDLLALVILDQACFELPWSREQIEEELLHPRALAFGYFQGEHLSGALLARWIDAELWIFRIMVHPKSQRQGMAHQLLSCLPDEPVWLEVRAGNQPAIGFYEKEGFKRVAVRAGYYPPLLAGQTFEDALLMCKGTKVLT